VGYPVTYSQVALSAQQLGIIDFYKFDLVDVCRVFSVPSILLNDNENSSYNNVTEAKKSFYREVIIPELMDLCDTINRVLKEPLSIRYPKHYFWFDTTGVLALQDDVTALIDNTLKLYDRGILTIDEVKLKLYR
jgi:phage portal protein BeeE